MKSASGQTREMLNMAFSLARKGAGCTSPNPMVGAVLENDGEIIGAGYHTWDGVKHAEILALEQAGGRARGSTLYINLEPCCHQGRTSACTGALIDAGVRRVIAAMPDPNPMVAGKGFARLREAGVSIWLDALSRELLESGEFAALVRDRGVSGATSNPTIFAKAITTSDRYDDQLHAAVAAGVRELQKLFLELGLEREGVAAFCTSYEQLLHCIEAKVARRVRRAT